MKNLHPANSKCFLHKPSFIHLSFLRFLGTYSVGKAQACTVCPEGKFCPSTTVATVTDCPGGTFSFGRQEQCTPCPKGWKCPNKDGTGNVKCLPVCMSFCHIV